MTTLVNSFSVQVTPIKDAFGSEQILSSFSAQVTPIKDAFGENTLIESCSMTYLNGVFDRIIRHK